MPRARHPSNRNAWPTLQGLSLLRVAQTAKRSCAGVSSSPFQYPSTACTAQAGVLGRLTLRVFCPCLHTWRTPSSPTLGNTRTCSSPARAKAVHYFTCAIGTEGCSMYRLDVYASASTLSLSTNRTEAVSLQKRVTLLQAPSLHRMPGRAQCGNSIPRCWPCAMGIRLLHNRAACTRQQLDMPYPSAARVTHRQAYLLVCVLLLHNEKRCQDSYSPSAD